MKQQDLTDMRVGWQKVVDSDIPGYPNTIYVFEEHGQITAVSNQKQGQGTLIETIHRSVPKLLITKDALPVKGEPPDYNVLYEGTGPLHHQEKP